MLVHLNKNRVISMHINYKLFLTLPIYSSAGIKVRNVNVSFLPTLEST